MRRDCLTRPRLARPHRGSLTARPGSLVLALLLVVGWGGRLPAQTVTIHFDGLGAEDGITELGATDFAISGSSWSGGLVATQGILPLYASIPASYEAQLGTAQVVFDTPVSEVSFFYVHGFTVLPGTASVFAPGDMLVVTVDSFLATTLGDPENFVTVTGGADGIARVEFDGAVVDDFSFALPQSDFVRGDCNGDGADDIADAIFLLSSVLFPVGAPAPLGCADACDANDDGALDIADAIATLDALFMGMPLPDPATCAGDPSAGDSLGCSSFAACP